MGWLKSIGNAFTDTLKKGGDLLTGGAFSAADEAKNQARRARREEALQAAKDLAQRQAIARSALVGGGRGGGESASIFDLLSRPS